MPTLRVAVQELFAVRDRPQLGALCIRAFEADAATSTVLDVPTRPRLTSAQLLRLLEPLPLARVVTAAELRTVAEQRQETTVPALTDNACAWLAHANGCIALLVAGLLASCIVCPSADDATVRCARQRMFDALRPVAGGWSIDDASVVRVGRLLVAQQLRPHVTAGSLSHAAVLILPRSGWQALHASFGAASPEWTALVGSYGELRRWLDPLAPFALDRLVLASLFPRDALVGMPSSGLIADVRPSVARLGFAWPGRKGAPPDDPLEASPVDLDAGGLITHVLLPTLTANGVPIPLMASLPPGPALPMVVGASAASGGWLELLDRAVKHFGFEGALGMLGHRPRDLVEFACGAPGSPPAAGGNAPAAGVSSPAASPSQPPVGEGSRISDTPDSRPAARPDGAGCAPRAPRTHIEILTGFREQGVRGHTKVLQELALLCDDRVSMIQPTRVLLIGPPGSGKTSILAALARATGRPYVRVDASSIAEHGWAGLQVADIAGMAYRAAGGDLRAAERAIVCLDEIDKVRTKISGLYESDGGVDRSTSHAVGVRTARQESMLGLLDTGPNTITFVPSAGAPPLSLATRQLVVICAGAFRQLEMAGVTPTDQELVEFGLIPEVVCRLTSRLVLDGPSADALVDLFQHGPDAVVPAAAICNALGVQLVMTPEAVRMVAEATAAGSGGLTPRTGAALIAAVVRRELLDALNGGAPAGGLLRVGPDEVLGELRRLAG